MPETAESSRGRRVAVVGAGIAGLAAAHRLGELDRERGLGLETVLFEAGRRLGGSIATERSDGFVIEAGPDSFLSEKPWALRLCERLGATQRLVGTREQFRQTFVAFGDRLHSLPDGFLLLAPTRFWPLITSPLFTWPGKLRMGLDLVLPRGAERADESLASFVTRRLGREALERVAQPLVSGIYTADPERLSLAATMPRFLEMERQHRSVILGMWRAQRRAAAASRPGSGARWSLFVSFDDGMQSLVDLIGDRLPASAVRLNSPIGSLRANADGRWQLDGDASPFDTVILACPAHVSAGLLGPLSAPLGEELAAISYASSATVTLAYRRASIPHALAGFGFVVPLVTGRSIVACTFSSIKYPGRAPEDFVLMRAFVGGAIQQRLFDQDDAEMLANVRRELKELLGITVEPVLTRIHRHPRAMPQYDVGHLQRVARIRESLPPGLHVAGNAYGGIGIPDCIHGGEVAAEAAVERLAARP